ncbi:MAG: four-carbon acid sugar kinase family protein [Acidimicrobiales bacterium]
MAHETGTFGGVPGSRSFIATADDTTGALETAASCADAGHSAVVVHHTRAAVHLGAADRDAHVVLVDLRSRHLGAPDAAARLGQVARSVGALQAHKIDSTLRGSWVAEVEALVALGRAVLLVPAFPRAGRTCVGGVVHVDGVPVHETAFGRDPRSPVTSSRPADRLLDAVEVGDAAAAGVALDAGARVVVGDAATDFDVRSYVDLLDGRPDLVVVGPAAVVAAAAGRGEGDTSPNDRHAVPGARALVVSASRHPAALEQLEAVRARGIVVVQPPADARVEDADRVLAELADAARHALAADPVVDVLVVIGGDTAAAVIGEADVTVHGTLDVGVASGTVVLDGRRLQLITKPGGFGTAGTVTGVLDQVMR